MANKVTRVKTEILESFDKDGNKIYDHKIEFSDGTKCSVSRKFDKNNNEIYYETSKGYWKKFEYDENGNLIYTEDSHGIWKKYKYNEQGKKTYYEDCFGCKIKYEFNEHGHRTLRKVLNCDSFREKIKYSPDGTIELDRITEVIL